MDRYSLFVIGVLALTAFIAYSTFATAQLLRRWQPPFNPLLDRGDTLLRLALIAVCVGLGLLSGLDRATLGWVLPAPLRQALVGLIVGGVLAAALFGLSRWLTSMGGNRFVAPEFTAMIAPRSRMELLLIALALVPVVVLEELLFRSLLVGGLSPLAPDWVLVIGGSVLFGAMHLPQRVGGIAGAGVASVALGALFVAEQSLLAPVVAHYVANFVQLALHLRTHATQ